VEEIKFWVLVDFASNFIYFFEIYCGKNLEAQVTVPVPWAETNAAYAVVMKLLHGLEGKMALHCNGQLFCSIPLFKDLVSKGIYATNTVRSNHIGLPTHLKNTKVWKKCNQGHIEWAMHESRCLFPPMQYQLDIHVCHVLQSRVEMGL
jgi:hypothetical protein